MLYTKFFNPPPPYVGSGSASAHRLRMQQSRQVGQRQEEPSSARKMREQQRALRSQAHGGIGMGIGKQRWQEDNNGETGLLVDAPEPCMLPIPAFMVRAM
jgi:hypothetical protein